MRVRVPSPLTSRDPRGAGLLARAGLALVALAALGCPSQPGPSASPSPAASSTPDSRRAEAKAAAQALGRALKARLSEAIQAGGVPEGISACKLAAPEITANEGRGSGLKIGRTSFKLRNPANSPPDWALSDVAGRVESPTFSTAPDGTLQALLPIRLEGLCLSCHGPEADLTPEVRAALARDYPEDRATGFASGDLRGWFWIEVPSK